MSVIREVTNAQLTDAWRTIDIDALQEDSPANFDTTTLHPPLPEIGEADVRALSGQVRQLLRGGDSEGALRGSLETPVYNGSDSAKVCVLCTGLGCFGDVVCVRTCRLEEGGGLDRGLYCGCPCCSVMRDGLREQAKAVISGW